MTTRLGRRQLDLTLDNVRLCAPIACARTARRSTRTLQPLQPLREPISFTLSGGQPVAAFVRVFERLVALQTQHEINKDIVVG
jgi:sulfatase maturation enzyme AslB (radical SAM superfamily)